MSETGPTTDGQQGAEGAQGGEGQAQQADPFAGRFNEFADEMRSSISGLNQEFASFREQQAPPDPGPQDPYADLLAPFEQQEQDQFGYGLDQEAQSPFQNGGDAQRFLVNLAERAAETKYGSEIETLKQQIQEDRTRQRANVIATQYPELSNQETVAKLLPVAEQMAQQLGNPDLAYHPDFIALQYLAGQAQATAQQQNANGQQDDIRLEGVHGGGGPAPGMSSDDEGDAIVAQAQRRDILSGGL